MISTRLLQALLAPPSTLKCSKAITLGYRNLISKKVVCSTFTTTTITPQPSEMKKIAEDKEHLSLPHLVHVFGKMKDRKDRLHDIKKRLEKLSEAGNPDPHHQLLHDYSKWGRTEMAEEVFTLMKEEGRSEFFTPQAFNTLLLAYCSAGQMDKASSLFKEMQDNEMEPDITTYSTLIIGYAKSNQEQKAVAVLQEMGNYDIIPTEEVVCAIIEAFARKNQVDEAMQFVDEVVTKFEVAPGDDVYCALIAAHTKNNHVQEAKELFKLAVAGNAFKPSARTYCTLIEAVSRLGAMNATNCCVLGWKDWRYSNCIQVL